MCYNISQKTREVIKTLIKKKIGNVDDHADQLDDCIEKIKTCFEEHRDCVSVFLLYYLCVEPVLSIINVL